MDFWGDSIPDINSASQDENPTAATASIPEVTEGGSWGAASEILGGILDFQLQRDRLKYETQVSRGAQTVYPNTGATFATAGGAVDNGTLKILIGVVVVALLLGVAAIAVRKAA